MRKEKLKRGFYFCFCLLFFVAFKAAASAANANSFAAKIATSSGGLNVRTEANASSRIIKSLKKDSYVTVIEKGDSFSKVEYAKGKYGFVKSSFLSKQSASVMYVATNGGNLNVRASNSKSAEIKDTLSFSQCVLVLKSGESRSKVLYNGTKTGYVSSAYLSQKKPSYSEVKLSVVSFKQTDERWKNVRLGSSSATIGKSGCTTTCVAMVDSFTLGKTITPKDSAQTLSYSSSGMLYWPSAYKTKQVSSKSEAYFEIYSLLKKGKPVIFAAKKESGSQHWVVVTGFSGASSLKASAFSINDPGSQKRKTVADFLEDYPNVYKIAYR